jgi:hypothetical protein
VYGVTEDRWAPSGALDWGKPLTQLSALDADEWVEAQETLSDEVLVPVPRTGGAAEDSILAYKVEVDVEQVKPRVCWMHAQTMATAQASSPSQDAS